AVTLLPARDETKTGRPVTASPAVDAGRRQTLGALAVGGVVPAEELVSVGDGFREVDQLAAGALGVASEQVEGLLLAEAVDGHENAPGALDRGAAGENAFEVLVWAGDLRV